MNKQNQDQRERCPVCHMEIVPEVGRIEHQGLEFGFCSRQCFDRFNAKPALYIGKPGMSSPKQRGECSIKRRVMKIDTCLSELERQQLTELIGDMMGVRQVHIEGETISLEYDLLEATHEQIETAMEQCGAKLGSDWGTQLKQSFIHFMEETELDALESDQSGHGCHHH